MAPAFVIIASVDDGMFYTVVPDKGNWLDDKGFEKDGCSSYVDEVDNILRVPEQYGKDPMDVIVATRDAEGRFVLIEPEHQQSDDNQDPSGPDDTLAVFLGIEPGVVRNVALSRGVDPAWLWGLDVLEQHANIGGVNVPFDDSEGHAYFKDSEYNDRKIRVAHKELHGMRRETFERLLSAPRARRVLPGSRVCVFYPDGEASGVCYSEVLEADNEVLHMHWDLGDPESTIQLLRMHLSGLLPDEPDVVEGALGGLKDNKRANKMTKTAVGFVLCGRDA